MGKSMYQKREREKVQRRVCALQACFSQILSRTTSGLKNTSPVNLKEWQMVIGLKIWSQTE